MEYKKRIGILTSCPSFINNYGAVLQAYALERQLKKMGHSPYIVKYADKYEYVHGRIGIIERIKGTILSKNISIKAKKRLILNKLFHRSIMPLFQEFQNECIDFYNDDYIDYEGLKKIANSFDAFIVGSDQVWNPIVHHGKNDPGYFLQFVPKGINRIAYAPSIGVDRIPDTCKENLKEYILSIDSISIREESGKRIIHDICGINVPVIVDPTLLLDMHDYDLIKNCNFCPRTPYLVYYCFGKLKKIDEIVKRIAEKNNYKVVCIPAGLDTSFSPDYRIGPKEFIGFISKAELICTDSFHATVFSIIYNRPFLAFAREKETGSSPTMNSRVKNLLKMFDIENCWCGDGEKVDYINLPHIDYAHVNEIRMIKSNEGKRFLEEALNSYE